MRGRPKHSFIQPYLTQRAGRKFWEIAYNHSGATKYISTRCQSRKDAEQELARFISGLNAPPEPDRISIKTVCEYYASHKESIYQQEKRDKQNTLSLNNSLKPVIAKLGFMLISDLKRAHIRKYTTERINMGYNPWTVIRELTFLKAALNYARKEGWLSIVPHIDMPSQPEALERWLTPEEAAKILNKIKTPHVKLFALTALSAPARPGAILRLKWSQIDFTNQRIRFRTQDEVTTNKRKVTAPLGGLLLEALKLAYSGRQTEYVIEYHGKHVKRIDKAFREAMRELKLEDITPNTLRHTAATWMAQRGIPFYEIAGIMGSSVRTVEKHYAKHHPDYLKNASNILNDVLKSTL